jgi:hypothetical protein
VVRWRSTGAHHEIQEQGRTGIFADHHLRVGEVISDSTPPQGMRILERRLDETEIGAGKYATLTEIEPEPKAAFAPVLASWKTVNEARAFSPKPFAGVARLRHRLVRVVRDYGMLDRREAPQYYPEIKPS